ncbi:MAG: hypothetical protein K2M48_00335, partial [Clostridiales bacterium]|nr:hypothetical protein [Clostridiales bacterium]
MEVRTDKPNNTVSTAPPKKAYVWLVGIFLISFAVIYIALVLRVHFLTVNNGLSIMGEGASNLMFAFALITLLGALYLYMAFSRKELLFRLKEPAAMMTVFTIVITANIYIEYFNPYAMF